MEATAAWEVMVVSAAVAAGEERTGLAQARTPGVARTVAMGAMVVTVV